MAWQALYGKRGFCDAMVSLVKRGCPEERIRALKNLLPLFAEDVELATEKRDRRPLFSQIPANSPSVPEAAIEVIFKIAFSDTGATPAVRAAAMEILRVIDKNMEKSEAVSMTEVRLEAQRAHDAAQSRLCRAQTKFPLG